MDNYRILIVDDDPTSLAISRALLENEYELTLVQSGMQALGFLRGNDPPDLILLDVVMPGIGGMEVLSILKNSAQCRDIPVIILTGENSVEEELKSYHNGASDFLSKPVNPKLLKIKIERQLHCLQLKRENDRLKNSLGVFKEQFDQLFASHFSQTGL